MAAVDVNQPAQEGPLKRAAQIDRLHITRHTGYLAKIWGTRAICPVIHRGLQYKSRETDPVRTMISEWRRLAFTMDELATAILQYLLTANKLNEKESLGKIAIVGDKDLEVVATIKGGDDPAGRPIQLKSEILGAIMLAHCIRSKIPVAKRAKKSIIKYEDKLALVLAID